MYYLNAMKVWNGYKVFADTAFVMRSGYHLYGLSRLHFSVDSSVECFYKRGESILEHQAKMAALYDLFISNFPGYFGGLSELTSNRGRFTWFLSLVSLFHDVGELDIGDIPDDGSKDHAAKDESEFNTFSNFVELGFVKADADPLKCYFSGFQEHRRDTGRALYALDKLEAVLTLAHLEMKGLSSNIDARSDVTTQDLRYQKFASTSCILDCWAVHLKKSIDSFPDTIKEPVYAVLKAAMNDVRGKFFDWWEKDLSILE